VSARNALAAVICDAGGTLVRLDFEWMAEDLGREGFTVAAADLRRAEIAGRRAYDGSTRGASGVRTRGDVRTYFAGMLASAGVPSRLRAAAVERWLARERTHGLWCRPMEGARAALDDLEQMGLRRAVVSNSDGRAEEHLVRAGLRAGIEFVVDSHRVGIEKPDPAIFSVALERLGCPPGEALFVGDLLSVDEAGARAAGMRFVLLDPYGDYGPPGGPRIAGMDDLAAWVRGAFEVRRGPGRPGTPAENGAVGGLP